MMDRQSEILQENAEMMGLFRESMEGRDEAEVKQRMNDVEFFLNEYLIDEAGPYTEGTFCLNDYLGDFYIRTCFSPTPEKIGRIAESIRMFYECLLGHGKIEEDAYQYLCEDIKENLASWQGTDESDLEVFNEDAYNSYGSFDPFAFYN